MSYTAAMPRTVHLWTKDKLLILERYLPGYLQATTSTFDRVYIDAFCGPGKNLVSETGELIDGSPLIALKSEAQNSTRFTKYIFIDNDTQNIDELRQNIVTLPQAGLCEFICGDVNTELPKAVRSLNQRAPAFVFLDTEDIEPRWSTIEAIADWRVEFLINFPLGMGINRNPDSLKTLEYFGTRDCLPLLQSSGTGRVRSILDLYKSRLKDLGFSYTTEDDRLIKTQDNHGLYYLIFVSKRQPAKPIMDWVLQQPDSKGQGRLL
jgi:three-Cys-motif partner protein